MKTCFVCGATGHWIDKASGEYLCLSHTMAAMGRLSHLSPREPAVLGPWQRLRQIQAWHAGSAYEKDQAMARRLEGVGR